MKTKIHSLTTTALFAAVISISAFIRIPTSLVPLTFQSVAVLITGYSLGPKQGAFAVILYTAVGLIGLPVFSSGGGPAYVLSPTFGYILGFTFCAVITGFCAKFNVRGSIFYAYLVMLAGLAGIYIPGVLWLIVSLKWLSAAGADIPTVIKAGLLIPLAGDLITTVPAAIAAVRIRESIYRL
ncbi:biotin transporter BioY [Candidatus Latescibacterota bacterium]